jgi:arginyl-tRNA synthetase
MDSRSGDAIGTRAALALGGDYGRGNLGRGESLQVEFVSANPTGPLTLLHGRGAAVGDALANLMEWNGYEVSREFYVNDAGSQVERFGRSIEACYLQVLGRPVPPGDDAYPGDYVRDLAQIIADREGARYLELPDDQRAGILAERAQQVVLEGQRATLDRLGVHFDRWYPERELHEGGLIEETIRLLRDAGCVYETDGALWLRASQFGDEQDRPLVRSNGLPTYIAADLAYHQEKFRRGFSHVIDVWGPDHEGYVARTRAGLQALGIDPARLDVLVFQPVTLKVDGLRVEGANRKSHAVMLEDVTELLGRAATRFSYLEQPAELPLELDLDLRRRQSAENPCFLIQSVLGQAEQALREARDRGCRPVSAERFDVSTLAEGLPAETDRQIASFPDRVQSAASRREPNEILNFAVQTTGLLGSLLGAAPPRAAGQPAREAHLALVEAGRSVLINAMSIIGVSAPERSI